MTVRVLVIEGHNLLRQGLCCMISEIPNFEVVGQASNGKDGIYQAVALHPNLILIDLCMPGMTGFEAIFQIPATHRLVLVRSRSQGCPLTAICWEHDEYDTLGRLVARYRSFEKGSPVGGIQRGWRRFDCHGHIMSGNDDLQ